MFRITFEINHHERELKMNLNNFTDSALWKIRTGKKKAMDNKKIISRNNTSTGFCCSLQLLTWSVSLTEHSRLQHCTMMVSTRMWNCRDEYFRQNETWRTRNQFKSRAQIHALIMWLELEINCTYILYIYVYKSARNLMRVEFLLWHLHDFKTDNLIKQMQRIPNKKFSVKSSISVL